MTGSGLIGLIEQAGEPDPSGYSAGLGTPHGLSSAELLAATSPGALQLHCLPTGPARTIRGIAEGSHATAVPQPGDLVLIREPVGRDRLSAAVTELARCGAAGIVVPDPEVAEWTDHAIGANLMLFSLGPGFTWPEAHREMAAALHGASGSTDRSEPGTLRDLTRALAAEIGAEVIVTDARMEPVAHALHVGADAAVRDWILFGRPPAAEREAWIRQAGVHVTAPTSQSDDRGDRTPWTLTPVHAGNDMLGGLWTACTAPEPHPSIVAAAARSAAGLLVQAAHVRDPRRRWHASLLAAAISGTGDPRHLLTALGIPTEAGLRLTAVDAAGNDLQHVQMELLAERVALRLADADVTAAVALTEATLWVLTSAEHSVAHITKAVRNDPSDRPPNVRIAIGDPTPAAEHIPHAAHELRLLLDMDLEPGVVTVEEWRSDLVIAEIAELADRRSCLRRGAIARLAEVDSDSRSEYLPTLRAYFDTNCDLQRTATRLHIHRNTLRYRLGRIRELSGLDLANPIHRLAADLQLRVHDFERRTPSAPSTS